MSAIFVLAAGGTGGHLFPAEALARELIARGQGAYLLTDARADALAAHNVGIEVCRVRAGRLGGGPVRTTHALAEIAAGVLQARRLLRRLSPAGVIGFGGYPSLPTMLAATHLGLPTLIHEQNAVIGRVNRLLARRVRHIATGFPGTKGLRPADSARAIHVGNPVRSAILAAGQSGYPPRGLEQPIELLVIGGSQGAHILSEVVPSALAALPIRHRAVLRVSQQARPEDLGAVAQAYAAHGIAAELDSFFTDVPARLARAHLVICRAGASTLAELAAAGRPALLVPYPHAAEDHQTMNAHAVAEAGGGWVIPQTELSAATLACRLESLLDDTAVLAAAAACAAGFGRRDAARDLALLALSLERPFMAAQHGRAA